VREGGETEEAQSVFLFECFFSAWKHPGECDRTKKPGGGEGNYPCGNDKHNEMDQSRHDAMDGNEHCKDK
jgi:hypothetical protein